MDKRDLEKFMNNLHEIGSKEVIKYEDEKGYVIIMPIVQTILNCEYLELDEAAEKQFLFEKVLPKDMKLNTITITTQIDKSKETGKEKDKGTIIDKEVEVKQLWLVKNQMGMSKAFKNKEDAMKYTNEQNDKLLKLAKMIEE